jgi:DNA-binding protein Fis
MSSGKKIAVLTSDALWHHHHPEVSALGWQCTVVGSREELRERMAAGGCDSVLVDGIDSVGALLNGSNQVFGITSLAEVQRRHIVHVLDSTRGNKAAAARILEIDTKTLYNRLKSYTRLGAIGPGSTDGGRGGQPRDPAPELNRPSQAAAGNPGSGNPGSGNPGSGNPKQGPGREHSTRRL